MHESGKTLKALLSHTIAIFGIVLIIIRLKRNFFQISMTFAVFLSAHGIIVVVVVVLYVNKKAFCFEHLSKSFYHWRRQSLE